MCIRDSEVCDRIRAMLPSPGAFATCGENVYKFADAVVTEGKGVPGTVLGISHGALVVACGDDAVAIRQIPVSYTHLSTLLLTFLA